MKHPQLVHLPLVAALLLPLPLLMAQRMGRGIRPWWMACRYLAWAGALGLLLALPSGWLLARAKGAPLGLAPKGSPLRRHEIAALLCLPLALGTLAALHRKRKDHEGLGWTAFFVGTLWAAAALPAGLSGHHMAQGHPVEPSAPKAAMAPPTADPETERPARALDFAALRPLRADAVKSMDHGGRWVRTWMNGRAETAFAANQALPPGSFVVLSSQEDRWGRPGPEVGPLWAYEIAADGKPRFQFYWASVPEARRAEAEGAARVYWRPDAPRLQACLACHGAGASDPAKRARPFLFRRR